MLPVTVNGFRSIYRLGRWLQASAWAVTRLSDQNFGRMVGI
jgi:hypothetical protein